MLSFNRNTSGDGTEFTINDLTSSLGKQSPFHFSLSYKASGFFFMTKYKLRTSGLPLSSLSGLFDHSHYCFQFFYRLPTLEISFELCILVSLDKKKSTISGSSSFPKYFTGIKGTCRNCRIHQMRKNLVLILMTLSSNYMCIANIFATHYPAILILWLL